MLLIVNSADRNVNYYYNSPTQFQIVFSKIIQNVKKVKLTNVIYNVTNNNNLFNFAANNQAFSYYIPPGYYTITNLLNTLQNGLNNIGSAQSPSFSFTLTFSYTIQTVTITCTTSCVIYFAVPGSCNSLLGFPYQNLTTNTTFTGINAPSLINPINLFLNIQELGLNTKV